MQLVKVSLVLLFSGCCAALFAIHASSPAVPKAPPGVIGSKNVESWASSRAASINNAWESYIDAEPTIHAYADAEMLAFVATATFKDTDYPSGVTATTGLPQLIVSTPAWFLELPKDVQSIKLQEGSVLASIVDDKTAEAPRETAKIALGALAGAVVAVVVL